MKHLRVSPKQFKHLKIAAIGPATREEIENLGLKVDVVPQRYIAESVVESLRGKARREDAFCWQEPKSPAT